MLDCLIPSRVVTYRPRPSDPWFDGECREAKRLTRRLERAYSAACRRATSQVNTSDDVVAAKTAWYTQRRNYTVNFVVVKAVLFGVPQLRVNERLQVNSGGR